MRYAQNHFLVTMQLNHHCTRCLQSLKKAQSSSHEIFNLQYSNFVCKNMSKLKKLGLYWWERYIHGSISWFSINSINYRDILDYCVLSGLIIRLRFVILVSSKSESYADIKINPKILVF